MSHRITFARFHFLAFNAYYLEMKERVLALYN